ncbi:MAG: 1,4-dihydroxy-6-naphthoate synthase [Desulfobacteraceae bacterium]|nr:1,4-dihydroxy-6-naphthoate synthase [Desulfobacteraceae bacterium]
MEENKKYSLAYSPCPNDTFIFKGIARNLIDLAGLAFDVVLEDVQTLNQDAAKGKHDITKLSFAALGNLLDDYALLRAGSALGEGCGPLIISLPGLNFGDTKKPVVAIPGTGTTAFYLFRFFLEAKFPGMDFTVKAMPFEQIMPAVLKKKADFGVIIHEGRFVYQNFNLEMKTDLGQWWEDTTGLPIPLGCIAIKRNLGKSFARTVEALIKISIDHAFSNPDMAYDYIEKHAQELDKTVISQHIKLYVNDFSKDPGPRGEAAIQTFLKKGIQAGIMTPSSLPLFAC